jgi:hypothetical protein
MSVVESSAFTFQDGSFSSRKLQNYILLFPKNTALIPDPVKTSKLVDLF